MSFDYLIEKIRSARFDEAPFRHVYIDDFLSPEHLSAILAAPEIGLAPASSDEDLFAKLFGAGYKIIQFPGCVTDQAQYVEWHKRRDRDNTVSPTTEGFGMTLRLISPRTPIIHELQTFLTGESFRTALAAKFDISLDAVFPDVGIQKYLDGYEISPHPDIRKKALTYMVNINPHTDAEMLSHHTHYLKFKDKYRYVQAFWEGNPKQDRCWVPWDWCESQSQQTRNNSIVIFAPSNDTVHAVKAEYDHLKAQRTQLYGNLWYEESVCDGHPSWDDFVIGKPAVATRSSAVDGLKALVPSRAKDFLKGRKGRADTANVLAGGLGERR